VNPKPKVKLIGKDGNVFSLVGTCTRVLKEKRLFKQAEALSHRVFSENTGSYQEALRICANYVEIE